MGGAGGAKPSHESIGGRASLGRKGTKFHIGPGLMHQKCSISIYSTPELVSVTGTLGETLSVCLQGSPSGMEEADT